MDGSALNLAHVEGKQAAALDALLGRRSVSTKMMGGPGPSGAELDLMVAAAVRAPDHGGMRPWRFVCFEGAARAGLGEVFAGAYARRNPGATDEQLARERGKPMRAPMLVAVAASIRADHPSVRVVDQQLAAGAAAMNLLNAAHLLGFGAVWLTGASCHDASVKAAIGLAGEDFVAGWIYLGTALAEAPRRERPQPSDVLLHWQGSPA